MACYMNLVVLLLAFVAISVHSRAQERDWAKFYEDRWNVNVTNERPKTPPRPTNVKTSSSRGDMPPHEAASWAIQPIEVDTSDINFSFSNTNNKNRNTASSTAQPLSTNPPHRTPQRPAPPRRDQQPSRTPQRPQPPRQDQHTSRPRLPNQRPNAGERLQGDGPRVANIPRSVMTADERKAIFTKYKTVLQLAEALNMDLTDAKRHPICGANGPTTTLDSLQSGVGVVQAALEILILVIQDSFAEVTMTTNIYQNLEVSYELLTSIKVTTEDVMTQLIQNDNGALTVYCPWPYQAVGGQCFYFNTNSTASWFQARTECKRRGGDLAVPQNLQLLQAQTLILRPDQRSLEFWLGGSDLTNEHEWSWLSGAPMDFTKGWNPGEPNNARGGEDCVMLLDKEYPPLNDARCERDNLHYICEAPPTNEPPAPKDQPNTQGKLVQDCGGKVNSGPVCFHVSSSTEYVPWFKARQTCEDMGGNIAQSYTQELVNYIMDRCGDKRWFWMGPSELETIRGTPETQVDLVMKTCHVFDAGQDGAPQMVQSACEGEWHYICQLPC